MLNVKPPADPAVNFQPFPERKPELHLTESKNSACKDSAPVETVETVEKSIQATWGCGNTSPDLKLSIKLSPSRRDSDVGSVVDCAAAHSFEPPPVPSLLDMATSASEVKSGKRVRKLKKRKLLKKAQGTELPESSDTELDGEALRPRWPRPRRRPSGGSQVSTSTQPSEDRDADVKVEGGGEACRPERTDPRSTKHRATLPQVAPAERTLSLDSEESMEVTAAGQQPHMDALVPASPSAQVPDTSIPEPQSLACNEVTSTSDMDVCKSSER